jgi:hypothetical protein
LSRECEDEKAMDEAIMANGFPSLKALGKPESKTEENGHDDPGVTGAMGAPSDELPSETPCKTLQEVEADKQWEILKSGLKVVAEEETVNLFYEAPILSAEEVKKIRVAADTGACAHCAGPGDLPGDTVVEQVEKRNFVGPNGQPIEHFGEAAVRLQQADGGHVSMRTQVMGVTRPLHSVSMICDGDRAKNKHNMLFTEDFGVVVPAGVFDEVLKRCKHIATYPREGGLYVAEMIVKTPGSGSPAPFAGQCLSR